jgi:hypothetical protein
MRWWHTKDRQTIINILVSLFHLGLEWVLKELVLLYFIIGEAKEILQKASLPMFANKALSLHLIALVKKTPICFATALGLWQIHQEWQPAALMWRHCIGAHSWREPLQVPLLQDWQQYSSLLWQQTWSE